MPAPSSELFLPDLEVVRQLGHGQAADVYLAREPGLKRLVAVKVLRSHGAGDGSDIRARFEREGRALAALNHPGVVQVYRTGQTGDGRPFLLMQYVEGRSLEERLAAEGPFSVAEARRVLGCVAEALAAAHRQGIVHRDLRPSNVLIDDESGRVLLSDFGLAAVLDTGNESATKITKTGQVVGDALSMSPEQIRGEKVTGQADVYQVGVLAYYLLTGEGPFGSGAPARIMFSHLEEEPRELTEIRMVVDPPLSDLMKKCLDKKPNRRPTAADLVRRLRELETPALPVPVGEGGAPLDLLKRRMPQFVVAAIAVAVALLSGVDQLKDNQILPPISYPLALIFSVHGVAATAIVSWFHGARGKQRVVALEVAALVAVAALWIAWSVWEVVRGL